MTTLNMRTEVTHYVDYRELEEFIQDTYGFQYEVVAAEECGNDTSLAFTVGTNFDNNDALLFEEMRQGIWHPYRTHMLLTKLASEGKIPTGKYIVEICW